jgi:hypothetical protein
VVKDWLIPTTMLMARNALRETRGWRLALRTHRLSEEKCPAPTIVWQVSDCCSMRCPYQPYLPPGCLAQVLRQWGLHARVDQIKEGKVDYTCDSWNDAKLLGWRIFSGVIYLDTIVTPSILELLYPLCKGMMELPILGSTKWRSMWRSWSRNTASPNSWPNGIQNLLYMEFSLACWPSDTHVACQTMQILMDSNCMHAKKKVSSVAGDAL